MASVMLAGQMNCPIQLDNLELKNVFHSVVRYLSLLVVAIPVPRMHVSFQWGGETIRLVIPACIAGRISGRDLISAAGEW